MVNTPLLHHNCNHYSATKVTRTDVVLWAYLWSGPLVCHTWYDVDLFSASGLKDHNEQYRATTLALNGPEAAS